MGDDEVDALLQRSADLHARFRQAGHLLHPRLHDPRKEASRAKLEEWRRDIEALDAHLAATAACCTALKLSESAAPAEDPAAVRAAERNRVMGFAMRLKADIRSLCHDGKELLAVASASDNPTDDSSAAQQAQAWERAIVDMERQLDAVQISRRGDLVTRLQLVELAEARDTLFARVGHALQRVKHKLDVQIGLAEFESVDDQSGGRLSAATRFFLAAAGHFSELAALARHELRQGERVAPTEEEMQRTIVIKRLEKDRELREALAAASGAGQAADGSGAGPPPRGSAARMQDAANTLRVIDGTYKDLRTKNLRLRGTNVQLRETLSQLETSNAETAVRYDAEVAAYNPRVQKLEQMVLSTRRAFQELRRDVDLVSGMYQRVSGSFDHVREHISTVTWECDRLADRAGAEEAAVRGLRAELAAAEQGNRRSMAALVRARDGLGRLDGQLAAQRERRAELDAKTEALRAIGERLDAEAARLAEDEAMLAESHAKQSKRLNDAKLLWRLRSSNYDELVRKLKEEMPDGFTPERRREFNALKEQLRQQRKETQQAEAKLLATNNKVFQVELSRQELLARMRKQALSEAAKRQALSEQL